MAIFKHVFAKTIDIDLISVAYNMWGMFVWLADQPYHPYDSIEIALLQTFDNNTVFLTVTWLTIGIYFCESC